MINYMRLAHQFKVPIPSIKAIQLVESAGAGFDPVTGKIKIQFEPSWFKRLTGLIVLNKVDIQKKEWEAFNLAFSKNPNKAMESTSWGSMQVMGFHWKRLGFASVGGMVDFAKESEENQLWLGLQFIRTDNRLYKALLDKDWKKVACYYNGAGYAINRYDKKLEQAEIKFRIL